MENYKVIHYVIVDLQLSGLHSVDNIPGEDVIFGCCLYSVFTC